MIWTRLCRSVRQETFSERKGSKGRVDGSTRMKGQREQRGRERADSQKKAREIGQEENQRVLEWTDGRSLFALLCESQRETRSAVAIRVSLEARTECNCGAPASLKSDPAPWKPRDAAGSGWIAAQKKEESIDPRSTLAVMTAAS